MDVRRRALLLGLTLGLAGGCGEAPKEGAKGGGGAAEVRHRAPVPLAELVAGVEAELGATERLLRQQGDAARELGRIHASFQSVAYFRRVPSDPAVAGLESNLRELARRVGLRLLRLGRRVDPPPKVPPRTLKAGEIWSPKLDELRGIVHLEIDLAGNRAQVASWIDRLVAEVERLVVVTRAEPVDGGFRLFAEAYFEHHIVSPKLALTWPTLRQRLAAAGHDPADPKLLARPACLKLKQLVDAGRGRLPEVKGALKVVADFPRWQLRRSFFEERSRAAVAMRGEAILARAGP